MAQFINIGSKEAPVVVPIDAVLPETPEGREWWEGVASGSIAVKDEVLDLLLKKTDETY